MRGGGLQGQISPFAVTSLQISDAAEIIEFV